MYELGMEAFLAIVGTRSISGAAKQLNLAQSTVSKRLKLLEQEMNTVLIDRKKGYKMLSLTLAGEAFIPIADRWHALWHETHSLNSLSSTLALSIGSLDSLNFAVFPGLFRALSLHEPKINLKIITAHSAELYDLIEQHQIDVGFTLLYREHPNIKIEKCYTDPMVGMRTALPTRSDADIVQPQELNPNEELFVNWGAHYQIWHDQWWSNLFSGRICLDTAQLIPAFLQNEKQWAIVPLSVARKAQKIGSYSIFRFTDIPPERICYKITHKYAKAGSLAGLSLLDRYFKQLADEL